MRTRGRLLVYIDLTRKRISRYSGKTRTDVFEYDEVPTAYWVEVLRLTPQAWKSDDTPPEVA